VICTPYVLCDLVALRSLDRGAKLCALYSQMSDVEAGGATVFPDLGAAIWPKKVSVILKSQRLEQGPNLVCIF
jgi:prolyl 4-hydroxylase